MQLFAEIFQLCSVWFDDFALRHATAYIVPPDEIGNPCYYSPTMACNMTEWFEQVTWLKIRAMDRFKFCLTVLCVADIAKHVGRVGQESGKSPRLAVFPW